MRAAPMMALLLLGVGCPARRAPEGPTLPDLLVEADAAWNDRMEVGLDAVEDILARALEVAPREPEVLWRLVRLYTAMGMAAEDPVVARNQYTFARARGLDCLESSAAFAQRRAEAGWEVAAAAIGPGREPCLTWTVFAWARWYVAFGPEAAALDLQAIDPLLAVASDLAPPRREDLVLWTRAILQAQRPAVDGRDLAQARTNLEEAIEREPADLSRHADLVRWVAVPLGDDALVARHSAVVRETEASTPEDLGAKARLAASPEGADRVAPQETDEP